MRTFIKLTAATLAMMLVVFLFAGCGEEEAAEVGTGTVPSRTRMPAGEVGQVEELIGKKVTPTEQTPADIRQSLESNRPVVILFYMASPYADTQVRSYFGSVENRYDGQVDFYTFLAADTQSYGDLADLLSVNATPTVVCINSDGQVVRAWTGYVDENSIEQGVVEATA
ncbi:MAG: hypothetical protein IBX61_00490 [Thermoleophilia bacterium]|nr:hypothetical protein [Thermoleophilia bacterium]